jgi:endonuclease YncB( thermonuclease family)
MKPLVAVLLFLINSIVVADITGYAYVIDGDTIDIKDVRIRLNGIDTPETEQTCTASGLIWHCGIEAAKVMHRLTKGKTVTCIGNTKDRYGRLIGNCFVGDLDLNATMVESGMALAYRYYSLEYVEQENIARETKKGLWSGEFVAPWDWRQGKRLPNN